MAAASESDARQKLQKQLDETSESVVAVAAEAEIKLKAGADENQRLRELLVDAARETQAASEGSRKCAINCGFCRL
jgi:hypothetical protein